MTQLHKSTLSASSWHSSTHCTSCRHVHDTTPQKHIMSARSWHNSTKTRHVGIFMTQLHKSMSRRHVHDTTPQKRVMSARLWRNSTKARHFGTFMTQLYKSTSCRHVHDTTPQKHVMSASSRHSSTQNLYDFCHFWFVIHQFLTESLYDRVDRGSDTAQNKMKTVI
jgi:uncharacterized protein (DUF2461 family)